jgi:excinuclease UvrABC helicase subunit UvrB
VTDHWQHERAIGETDRHRRDRQIAYNEKARHHPDDGEENVEDILSLYVTST